MTKLLLSLLVTALLVGLLLPSTTVSAKKADLVTKDEIHALIPDLPEDENVAYLGKKFSWRNLSFVEGYAIVHYKKNNARRNAFARVGRNNTCYSFLADGAKWKNVEDWVMNPANTQGLDGNALFSTVENAIAKWEDAADGKAGDGNSMNIIGNGTSVNYPLFPDTTSPDGHNEVMFGDINSQGAIAVAIVWGIFSGPKQRRQLVEWDMVFDQGDFNWSLTGDATKIDFDNIATHEIGHTFGLADLYNTCAEETMYGYATEGETKKRSLNAGDILGVSTLY